MGLKKKKKVSVQTGLHVKQGSNWRMNFLLPVLSPTVAFWSRIFWIYLALLCPGRPIKTKCLLNSIDSVTFSRVTVLNLASMNWPVNFMKCETCICACVKFSRERIHRFHQKELSIQKKMENNFLEWFWWYLQVRDRIKYQKRMEKSTHLGSWLFIHIESF